MENQFKILKDIAYGDHERQRLDLFIPENIKSADGVILFTHGGGWSNGSKEIHHPDSEKLARSGYICASINYRFVSESICVFDELDDITSALSTVKNECLKLGINPERALLSGGSAGAHLSLLYAYSRKEEAPLLPAAVCAYCPPVNCAAPDFLLGISGEFEEWKYSVLSKCCREKISKNNLLCPIAQKALKRISPEEYISEASVPTAVFQGKKDELIPFSHIESFIRRLNKAGIPNDLIVYENSGHALDKDNAASEKALNMIKQYAKKYL